jgi:hypothetical protein
MLLICMQKHQPFVIVFKYNDRQLSVGVMPTGKDEKNPDGFKIILDGESCGVIRHIADHWVSDDMEDESLAELIGTCINKLYKKVDRILKKQTPAKFSMN